MNEKPEVKGDLDAAQQALAALWPVLNILESAEPQPGQTPLEYQATIAAVVKQVKAEIAPLYTKAMGD